MSETVEKKVLPVVVGQPVKQWVFNELVQSSEDTVGMIAYYFYKLEKECIAQDYRRKNYSEEAIEEELKRFHDSRLNTVGLNGYRDRASNFLNSYTKDIKKKQHEFYVSTSYKVVDKLKKQIFLVENEKKEIINKYEKEIKNTKKKAINEFVNKINTNTKVYKNIAQVLKEWFTKRILDILYTLLLALFAISVVFYSASKEVRGIVVNSFQNKVITYTDNLKK